MAEGRRPNSKSVVSPDSDWRQLESVLRNRQVCDSSCRFFTTCPAQPLSYLDDDRKCVMKMLGEPMRRTYLNLMLRGEEGVLDEMRRVLFTFARKVNISDKTKDVKEYFELLAKFHKSVYGDKVSSDDESLKQLDVTIRRIGRDVPTTTVADMEVPIPEGLVSDAQLCDPESLYYNPVYAKTRGGVLKEDADP